MKVIFLDIDGVLNSETWYQWRQYCYHNGKQNEIYDTTIQPIEETNSKFIWMQSEIDPRLVANLNKIIRETDCEIVLSSSWRSSSETENAFLNNVLKSKGLIKPFVYVTGYAQSGSRGDDIQEWLNKCQDIESYCIIDDDIFDMLDSQLNNLVHTDFYYGLTSANADAVIKILNR